MIVIKKTEYCDACRCSEKKSEQTGYQQIQFTEMEQQEVEEKNSSEKPYSARNQKFRFQLTEIL
jgi:hypothetical protein